MPVTAKVDENMHNSSTHLRGGGGLDPDQDQHAIRPDLGPNCLQRLSADDIKSSPARKE